MLSFGGGLHNSAHIFCTGNGNNGVIQGSNNTNCNNKSCNNKNCNNVNCGNSSHQTQTSVVGDVNASGELVSIQSRFPLWGAHSTMVCVLALHLEAPGLILSASKIFFD